MRVELVTTQKRQAAKILANLHTSKKPVLITEHGKPSAYLVDVEDYEFMQQRMVILEDVARGEQAEYIALSNLEAAKKLTQKVFDKIIRRENHPERGKIPFELKI